MKLSSATKTKALPWVVLMIGLFQLFIVDQPISAGVFLLLGFVMLVELIWPEKWGNRK